MHYSRDLQIKRWLQEETAGPYYVKSHCMLTGGNLVDVYAFKDSADAMMFSMMWS